MSMLTKEFSFELPEEQIARYPAKERTASRLLVLHKQTGAIKDHVFSAIHEYIQPGDLLILNNSKVMRARMFGHKETGGKIEILIERVLDQNHAWAQIKASKSPQNNSWLIFNSDVKARVIEHDFSTGLYRIEFSHTKTQSIFEILEQYGEVPLPPYMNRAAENNDLERYQTVYAQHVGSIAAPTAGLHFSAELIQELKDKGVEFATTTLHVGFGTFQAVKTENIHDHKMHSEWLDVNAELCSKVKAAKQRGNKVITVGSTATRAVETAAMNGELQPISGFTDIFITPGYKFKVTDGMITNFHIPESTLLMLVSALAGKDNIMNAYDHAIKNAYRFYSYGDAMLIMDY